ncbi:MAG: hypothetical protein GY874_15920 [Desulfobacteraceae bacterium]|nr:hypothetical protein [Desulfobacteraceae bacterium]
MNSTNDVNGRSGCGSLSVEPDVTSLAGSGKSKNITKLSFGNDYNIPRASPGNDNREQGPSNNINKLMSASNEDEPQRISSEKMKPLRKRIGIDCWKIIAAYIPAPANLSELEEIANKIPEIKAAISTSFVPHHEVLIEQYREDLKESNQYREDFCWSNQFREVLDWPNHQYGEAVYWSNKNCSLGENTKPNSKKAEIVLLMDQAAINLEDKYKNLEDVKNVKNVGKERNDNQGKAKTFNLTEIRKKLVLHFDKKVREISDSDLNSNSIEQFKDSFSYGSKNPIKIKGKGEYKLYRPKRKSTSWYGNKKEHGLSIESDAGFIGYKMMHEGEEVFSFGKKISSDRNTISEGRFSFMFDATGESDPGKVRRRPVLADGVKTYGDGDIIEKGTFDYNSSMNSYVLIDGTKINYINNTIKSGTFECNPDFNRMELSTGKIYEYGGNPNKPQLIHTLKDGNYV